MSALFFPCAGMLENSSALSTHKAHFLRAQIPPEEFCSRIRDSCERQKIILPKNI